MKNTHYLILLLFLCGITSVAADKMDLCHAFVLLTNQCDDISALKGDKIPEDYGYYFSSLEVEGASRSFINAMLIDNVSFVAEFNKYDSEAKAFEKVDSLKKEIFRCFPDLKFVDTKSKFKDPISYIGQYVNDGFRFYEAYLKIAKYGQAWSVSFVYPQADEGEKSYTDYTRNKEAVDQSTFSKDINRLLEESKTDFESIKAEELDNISMFTQYATTFMPAGSSDCYIEDRGLEIIFYEMTILKNVSLDELKKNAGEIIRKVMRSLGTEYGYFQSPSGSSIRFVHQDRPNELAVLVYFEEVGGSYNMNISIKAPQKPIS